MIFNCLIDCFLLKDYTENELAGLKVEHSKEFIQEGQSIVLTLKDKNVLDENEGDVLVNVNVVDDEKAAKNIENKKKLPTYKPYDEVDEFGVVSIDLLYFYLDYASVCIFFLSLKRSQYSINMMRN